MSPMRDQIMAALIAEAIEIGKDGGDAQSELKRRYPDMPPSIIAGVWWEAQEAIDERWWQSVERTIDAEVIKNAISTAK